MIQVLAISGSLRQRSVNRALVESSIFLAPGDIEIIVYDEIGNLPFFNPDLEGFEPPEVLDFRAKLKASSGILISSPEYAHGITGVLKNALVGCWERRICGEASVSDQYLFTKHHCV